MSQQSGNIQLFITTYGTYLHVKDALFEVRTTAKSGKYQKQHFAASKVRSIVFTVAGALSTEAVTLALEHHIDIVFSKQDGHPRGRVWHSRPGSTTRIRKQQLRASITDQGLELAASWIIRKLDQQQTMLQLLGKHRKTQQALIQEAREKIQRLSDSIAATAKDATITDRPASIRGLEGTAGRHYFQTISQLLPPKYRFAGRSMRPAKDPFNAMLNYAYGILYGRVEKALLLAGLDPFTGFFHRDDYNLTSMVFDFIEPYRIHADYTAFRLFSGKKVNQDCFRSLQGGVQLDKAGKQLLIEAFTDYLDVKKVRHRGRNLTRGHVLQLEAHRLANLLLAQDLPIPQTIQL